MELLKHIQAQRSNVLTMLAETFFYEIRKETAPLFVMGFNPLYLPSRYCSATIMSEEDDYELSDIYDGIDILVIVPGQAGVLLRNVILNNKEIRYSSKNDKYKYTYDVTFSEIILNYM